MLISKFDLYKTGWLDLVFDDRNKAYGAYQLRQENSRTMLKSMGIAFATIGIAAVGVGILIKPVATTGDKISSTVVHIFHYVAPPPPVTPPKPLTHRSPAPALPAAAGAVHRFVPIVVAHDVVAQDPPKLVDLKTGGIGTTNIPAAGIGNGPATVTTTTGEAAPPSPGEVYSPVGLERMPEPFGGAASWSKFLQKNLKYPDMAIDQHMSGKVWVSFIVEKDGSLSNIVVSRGAGFGMDEEAMRVLKLAHAWKPGIQNGQPVRVKYDLPINFILGDDSN
jgi:protein TonB